MYTNTNTNTLTNTLTNTHTHKYTYTDERNRNEKERQREKLKVHKIRFVWLFFSRKFKYWGVAERLNDEVKTWNDEPIQIQILWTWWIMKHQSFALGSIFSFIFFLFALQIPRTYVQFHIMNFSTIQLLFFRIIY